MRLTDIVGQDQAISVLRRARVQKRIHHTILFCGPRGIGKWTTANALAAAALCSEPGEDSCGRCSTCSMVDKLSHPDVHYVFPLAGVSESDKTRRLAAETELLANILEARRTNPFAHESLAGNPVIGVGWVRQIQRRLALKPHSGCRHVIIVRQIEHMNAVAANAFLKTLEEPPGHSLIILTTDAPARLLPTVLSRCQRVPFRRLPTPAMRQVTGRLANAVAPSGSHAGLIPPPTNDVISQSEGSPGHLVTLLTEGSSPMRAKAFELIAAGFGPNIPAAIDAFGRISGPECAALLDGMIAAYRDILAFHCGQMPVHVDQRAATERAAHRIGQDALPGLLSIAVERRRLFQSEGTRNVNPTLLLAVFFAELAAEGA